MSQHLCLPHEVIYLPGHLPSKSHHSNFPLYFSTFPWILLCGSISPLLPPLCFPLYFLQVCHKLFLCHLLEPPRPTLSSSPLVALLSCVHFKYWLQRHPLCHGCLSSPYVGNFWTRSCHFLHYFRPGHHPYLVWYSLRSFTHDLSEKNRLCALYPPLHCPRNYPSLISKN